MIRTSAPPSAASTGIPAGKSLVPSGSLTVTVPGTVIDGLDVSGQINVRANNVTIKNTRVITGGYYGIDLGYGATGVTVSHCEITASATHYTGVKGGGFTMDNCYIHGFENAITLTDGNTIVTSCFIEKMDGVGSPHYDGIEIYAGNNYEIRNNAIRLTDTNGNWLNDTGAINITPTWSNISDVIIDGNWLGGGSYTLNLDEQGGYTLTNLTVTNNRWYGSAPAGHAAYGPIRAGNLITTAAHNTWHDTGQPI